MGDISYYRDEVNQRTVFVTKIHDNELMMIDKGSIIQEIRARISTQVCNKIMEIIGPKIDEAFKELNK